MNKRILKQFAYGTGFLATLGLVVFIIYLVALKPAPNCSDRRQNQGETDIDCGGPCPACEIRQLVLPEILSIKVLPSEGRTAIFAEARNPNAGWAAISIDYDLEIYDTDGNKMESVTGKTFFYANETKRLLEILNIPSRNIGRTEMIFSDPSWMSETQFMPPVVQSENIVTEKSALAQSIIVRGDLINENPFIVSKAAIIATLANETNTIIAASRTEVNNIGADSRASFQVNFPSGLDLKTGTTSVPTLVDPRQTKIYIEAQR